MLKMIKCKMDTEFNERLTSCSINFFHRTDIGSGRNRCFYSCMPQFGRSVTTNGNGVSSAESTPTEE